MKIKQTFYQVELNLSKIYIFELEIIFCEKSILSLVL